MSTPAGWYPDPYNPAQQRWWNGLEWGNETQPNQPVFPPSSATAQYAPGPQYAAAPPYATEAMGYGDVAPASVLLTLPAVSPWGRLGAYLLEGLLVTVTLGIGWLFWAATLADKGQTPAKKLLDQRVIMDFSGQPASFSRMLFLRGFVAGFVASFAVAFTLGIALFMPFWDSKNRNIWDHVSSTRVVRDRS